MKRKIDEFERGERGERERDNEEIVGELSMERTSGGLAVKRDE